MRGTWFVGVRFPRPLRATPTFSDNGVGTYRTVAGDGTTTHTLTFSSISGGINSEGVMLFFSGTGTDGDIGSFQVQEGRVMFFDAEL